MGAARVSEHGKMEQGLRQNALEWGSSWNGALSRVASVHITPLAAAGVAAFVSFVLGAYAALQSPGLQLEPDLVANALYFDQLLKGEKSLGELWYFTAPKPLTIVFLGGVVGGLGAVLVSSAIAALAVFSISFVVARGFGGLVGLVAGLMLTQDPRWSILLSVGGADLFTATFVAAAIAAWVGGRERIAATAVFLAVLGKPTAAVVVAPLLLDVERELRPRLRLVAAAAAGLLATAACYYALLGGVDVPSRFLVAYSSLVPPPPAPLGWLVGYFRDDLASKLLWMSWPLALIGLGAVAATREARALRQLIGAALLLAVAHVALAWWTDTQLFARFLWMLEASAVVLSVVGAFWAPRALATRGHSSRLCGGLTLLALGVLFMNLQSAGSLRNSEYARYFSDRALKAAPLIDHLSRVRAPAEAVVSPLWLQASVLRRLGLSSTPGDVRAAEVLGARNQDDSRDVRWLLFAPGLYEKTGERWVRAELEAHSYSRVAESGSPPFLLLRRD